MIGSISEGRRSNACLTAAALLTVALSGIEARASEPNAQRVSHFVGAAGESVAIQVPPFHGIEPRLSLSYSSEARNGFAGMGWELTGFSVIERVNGAWGVPQLSADDVYTLDGQTLLACSSASAAYPSCATGGTHYTPHESYLKVKKVDDEHWEVYGKDGTRTEFTRIQGASYPFDGPPVSLRLGQSKVVDTHGNFVSYNWAVNVGGVVGATYPSSVVYNGYQIDFFREARPEGPLTRRAFNDVGRMAERLKSVVVRRLTEPEPVIRAYKIGYTTSVATGKSLLSSVEMYGKGAGVSGTGDITGVSLPAQTFGYQPDTAVTSFTGDVQMSNAGPGPAQATEWVVWSYRTKTTPSLDGSSLMADAEPAGWDKSGYSSRALSSGNGYAQIVFTQGSGRTFYLGQFGMYLSPNNTIMASANGVYITGEIPVVHGNSLTIEVVTGGVHWKVNDVVVANWVGTPSYPMVVFAGLYQGGDQIAQALLSGSLVNYFGTDCGGSPRFSGDFNGDGRQDSVCKTSIHDLAVTLSTASGFSNPIIWANWNQNIAGVGDFNNDGRDDILFFESWAGTTFVGLSDGLDFGAITPWGAISGYSQTYPWPSYSCRMNGATIAKVGDITGDGKADVLCYTPADPNRQFVGVSSGTGFSSYVFGETDCPSYLSVSADLNADGREDAFCMSTNGDVRPLVSLGSAMGSLHPLYGFCSASEYTFGDWNGDGTSDAACANNLRAGLQTGRLFAVLDAPVPAAWCVSGQRIAADLDGDGAAEWVCNNSGTPTNDIEVRRWNGLAFGAAQTWRGGFCAGTIAAADFNGDAKKDLLCESSGAVIYAGTKNVKADLLTQSTNGIGGTATLTWSTTTASAQNATGGAPTSGLPAKYIVMSTTANDGRTGPQATTFLYRGGAQDDLERKFFGFSTVVEYPPKLSTETESPAIVKSFHTDKLRAGRLEWLRRYSGATSGLVISETNYVYTTTEDTGAAPRRTTLLTAVWNYKHTGLAGGCASWPCTTARRTKVEYTYDAYGNVVQLTNHGDFDVSGDETLDHHYYTPNTSAYIVGLLGGVDKYQGTSTGGAILNRNFNSRDGAPWTTPPTKGDVTATWTWLASESRWLTSTATFDTYGNATSATDPTGRTVSVGFDTTHRTYPTSVTNGANETTSTTWDYRCAVPVETTDPNNLITTAATDAFCRPTTTTLSGYGIVSTASYSGLGNVATQKTRVDTPGPDGATDWSESYFDGFGRTYKAVKRGPSADEAIVTEVEYDARGHVWSQKSPYYANAPGDTVKVTTFEYDWFDRPVKTILPDATTRQVLYSTLSLDTPPLFETITTNELGQQATTKFDALGRVRRTEKSTAAHGTLVTQRNYDLLGRMTTLIDPANNTWTYTYDNLGRNLTKNDPDAGMWYFNYDDAGRVLSQTDAKLQATTLEYDAAGRPRFKKIRPSGGPTGTVTEYVETTYGTSAGSFNMGRATQVVRKNHATGLEMNGKLTFEYDALGRVKKQTRTLDGTNYVVEKFFDTAGYLRGIKYPDGDYVGDIQGVGLTPIVYDGAGRIQSIPGILSSVTYNALGAPLIQTNANGTTTTKTYDGDRFWLTNILTTGPSSTLQNLHYTLNNAGMAMGVDSDVANEDWTYGYDDLNRLTSSTNGVPANNQTWTYDSVGRITNNSRIGSYQYNAGTGIKPAHGVKTINVMTELFYDANGNMTSGNGRSMTWNHENMITQVVANSKTTMFTYGPDGDRIKKAEGSNVVKYPFGDDYEIDAAGQVTKYFNAGFGPIAKKVGTTLYWLHTDRMGSINATTDSGGAWMLRRSHRSYGEFFGETRPTGGTHAESLAYIGQRTDEETKNGTTDDKGLTYLHARYYDAALGIFLSPDPARADRNTYRYASGDPVNRLDPRGLAEECPSTVCVDAPMPPWPQPPGPAPLPGPHPDNPQDSEHCVPNYFNGVFQSPNDPRCNGGPGQTPPDCSAGSPHPSCPPSPAEVPKDLPIPVCREGQGIAAGEMCTNPREYACPNAMLGLPCPSNHPGSGNEPCRVDGSCTARDLGFAPPLPNLFGGCPTIGAQFEAHLNSWGELLRSEEVQSGYGVVDDVDDAVGLYKVNRTLGRPAVGVAANAVYRLPLYTGSFLGGSVIGSFIRGVGDYVACTPR